MFGNNGDTWQEWDRKAMEVCNTWKCERLNCHFFISFTELFFFCRLFVHLNFILQMLCAHVRVMLVTNIAYPLNCCHTKVRVFMWKRRKSSIFFRVCSVHTMKNDCKAVICLLKNSEKPDSRQGLGSKYGWLYFCFVSCCAWERFFLVNPPAVLIENYQKIFSFNVCPPIFSSFSPLFHHLCMWVAVVVVLFLFKTVSETSQTFFHFSLGAKHIFKWISSLCLLRCIFCFSWFNLFFFFRFMSHTLKLVNFDTFLLFLPNRFSYNREIRHTKACCKLYTTVYT